MSDAPARPTGLRPWLLAARPKTLPAAFVPVAIGSALAAQAGAFQPLPAGLCLAFALLIQIGTNYANDYYDARSGADTAARIGPARAVASGWVSPSAMRRAMVLTFALAFLVGLGLIPFGGWGLLLIGVLSVLCGLAYTGGPYPLGYNGLGDVFVFVFFGGVAVWATDYVQTGGGPWEVVLLAACIPGALATNLLVVNNHRDLETDRVAGKRTLAVRWGRGFSLLEYIALQALWLAAVLALAWLQRNPWGLLPCVFLPWAVRLCLALGRARCREDFGRVLQGTAGLLTGAGLLTALGLVLGGR